MIARYTRPELGRIWGEENRFRTWLEVEIAATETLAEAGIVPKPAAKAIRERAGVRRGADDRVARRAVPLRLLEPGHLLRVPPDLLPRARLQEARSAELLRRRRAVAPSVSERSTTIIKAIPGWNPRRVLLPNGGSRQFTPSRSLSVLSWPTGTPKFSGTLNALTAHGKRCGWGSFQARWGRSRILVPT